MKEKDIEGEVFLGEISSVASDVVARSRKDATATGVGSIWGFGDYKGFRHWIKIQN